MVSPSRISYNCTALHDHRSRRGGIVFYRRSPTSLKKDKVNPRTSDVCCAHFNFRIRKTLNFRWEFSRVTWLCSASPNLLGTTRASPEKLPHLLLPPYFSRRRALLGSHRQPFCDFPGAYLYPSKFLQLWRYITPIVLRLTSFVCQVAYLFS